MTYKGNNYRRRGAGYAQAAVEGRMSDYRVAFTKNLFGSFNIRQYLPKDETEEDVRAYALENQIGPTVQLQLDLQKMRRPIGMNLTNLTIEELDALRSIINLAFDLAEPVVKDRDKVAQDAKDAGDDSYARVYRQIPEFVVRTGKVLAYGEGVLDRLAGILERFGGGLPRFVERWGTRVLGDGDVVADEASADSGSEDDGPQAD